MIATDESTCQHSYTIDFPGFLTGRNTLGTKSCEKCGNQITLKWFWKMIYFAVLAAPISLAALYGKISWGNFAIVLLAGFYFALFVQWQIVLHGKYCLLKK